MEAVQRNSTAAGKLRAVEHRIARIDAIEQAPTSPGSKSDWWSWSKSGLI